MTNAATELMDSLAPGDDPILHSRRGRPRIHLRKLALTSIELERWLATLRLTHKHFARMLRVSHTSVRNWLNGDRAVPGWVSAFLEMYTLWEDSCRQRYTVQQLKELVYDFLAQQPRAVAPEVVADRLRLPVGVVLETVERLKAENALDAEGVQ